MVTSILVPSPGPLRTSRVPPSTLAHPHDPVPVFGHSCGVEAPAVVLDREPHPVGGGDEPDGRALRPACRATFVSASWQMR